MNVITRGIRNAFRNSTRTISIVAILGLSIGLSLTMLIAHKAVNQKIASVKSSIGNTISIAPAGFSGFNGGGNPLTADQLKKVASLTHITKVDESINDRLSSSNTNLASAVDAGSLGRRFGGGEGFGGFGGDAIAGDTAPRTFTPPITALGTTDTTKLNNNSITLSGGNQIDGTKDTDTALVGKALASKNNLAVGSTFTAYNTTVTVAGIFDTGTTFGNNQVIFALSTLQRLSGQGSDITSATAYVDSISNMDNATSAIKSALGSNNADVTSSKESAESAVEPLQSIQKVALFSLIGATIAGGVIILLTMVMIVRERQREIGVLKAIGGSNLKIMGQFMVESLTLAVLGAVIGLAIGIIGGQPVTKMLVNNSTNNSTVASTMDMPGGQRQMRGSFNEGSGALRTSGGQSMQARGFGAGLRNNGTLKGIGNIHAEIGWSIILYGLGAAILIALFGSALAATLIAKVRPSQVMRTE
ncbi:MAG TPA: FtsX-like permease family protein [Candidatus Saccharimonadales bacterium]|nr:FtsX-like permease family protein [Candidatus Saccharimonadales bacterium]